MADTRNSDSKRTGPPPVPEFIKEKQKAKKYKPKTLKIEPHTFPYKADAKQEEKQISGFKVIIDARKGDHATTLTELSNFLPDDAKYYSLLKQKGKGKNPGWFSLVHFEFIDKEGNSTIKPQWVLLKKSKISQDISEFITGKMLNELAGDQAASISLCHEGSKGGAYVVSLMYPGFVDAWERYVDERNADRLEAKLTTQKPPENRLKMAGGLNKFIQDGIGKPGNSHHPSINQTFKGFHLCFGLSFLMRNFDIHLANLGIVYTYKDKQPIQILVDEDKISALKEFKKNIRLALNENDLKMYKEINQQYVNYKKSLGVEESHVLIDHGWAQAKWKTHVLKFLKDGETGFESRIDHLPGIGPTNHFQEIKRSIRYTEEFVDALDQICAAFIEKKNDLSTLLRINLDRVEEFYGRPGLIEYAKYIGLTQGQKEDDFNPNNVKEKILDFIANLAVPTEILVLNKLAFETRLSLCFPEQGEWKFENGHNQWKGTGKFIFDFDKYFKLIQIYHDSDLLQGDLHFRGPGQKNHQSSLRKLASEKYNECIASREYVGFLKSKLKSESKNELSEIKEKTTTRWSSPSTSLSDSTFSAYSPIERSRLFSSSSPPQSSPSQSSPSPLSRSEVGKKAIEQHRKKSSGGS